MAKISELTTLTSPITSSDLVMVIRPASGGGYASFKSPLNQFGNVGFTGSAEMTSSVGIKMSGSFAAATVGASIVGPLKYSTYIKNGLNGYSRVELGGNYSQPYLSGLNIFNSSSLLDWGSGSGFMWYNVGQSKTPFGGVSQYGYIVRSQYQGTTVGSASYFSLATASQAIWVLRPTFNDQIDNAANNSYYCNAIDISNPSLQHALVYKVITGSYGNTGSMLSVISIGVDDNSYSAGTFSGVTSAGAGSAIRMLSGSLYMPSSFGFKLGHFGGVSYTNQVRLGCDLGGDGYIAFSSASSGPGLVSIPSTTSASLALSTTSGDILISTGIGGTFGLNRTIIYGSLSTTGSINSTGYINLPKGNSSTLGIATAAEKFTGSMAFDTSSMNMVVFTGDGSTTFAGSTGWKVVTLS